MEASGFLQGSFLFAFYLAHFIILEQCLSLFLRSDSDELKQFLEHHGLQQCLSRLQDMNVTDLNILRKLSPQDLKIAKFEYCIREKLWKALHDISENHKEIELLSQSEETENDSASSALRDQEKKKKRKSKKNNRKNGEHNKCGNLQQKIQEKEQEEARYCFSGQNEDSQPW